MYRGEFWTGPQDVFYLCLLLYSYCDRFTDCLSKSGTHYEFTTSNLEPQYKNVKKEKRKINFHKKNMKMLTKNHSQTRETRQVAFMVFPNKKIVQELAFSP